LIKRKQLRQWSHALEVELVMQLLILDAGHAKDTKGKNNLKEN
jgi:hypothetical protein